MSFKGIGLGGSFYTVRGGDSSPSLTRRFTITQNIQRGVAYRFRYRSRNVIGWSGWSPIASLSASTIPAPPPKPTYVSSTNDMITLNFSRSTDNGGSLITDYELQVDGEVISDYDFAADGYSYTVDRTTLSLATVTLTTGSVYSFRYRAINANGNSLWSQPTSVAFAPLPATPSGLARKSTGNSETTIGLTWSSISGEALPVLQYILYVDDGTSSDIKEIYRGSGTSFIMTNSIPGYEYTFFVSAENFNGEGTLSSGLDLKSCVAPYSVKPPVLVGSTSTSLDLSWQSPGSDGG
jgi:hypothetical protein